MLNDNAGWIAGNKGVILKTINGGSQWMLQNSGTQANLRDVHFVDANRGWAVGEGGVIVGTHDGGRSWYVVQPSVTALPLKAVWRNSNTLAWAGGTSGAYAFTGATPDSLQWNLGSFGASNQVFGVQFVDDQTGFAVGSNGTGLVLRTVDGGLVWSPQVSNSAQALNDVYFVDTLRGWAVGAAGRIVHTSKGGF